MILIEEDIYEPLSEWVRSSFGKASSHSKRITFVEITAETPYFKSRARKRLLKPDVSALDSQNQLILFECKLEDPLRSPQLFDYIKGADFVYAVLHEENNLDMYQKMLSSIDVGLITYRSTRGKYDFTIQSESQNLNGIYTKSNVNFFLREIKSKPKIIIFPHTRKFFPTKNDLEQRIRNLRNGTRPIYRYKVNRPLPPGSIVLFAYHKEIIGQAVVKIFRDATKEERQNSDYDPKYVFESSGDLVSVFPNPVKYEELRGFPRFKNKSIHSIIRSYPYISPNVYLHILSKAC